MIVFSHGSLSFKHLDGDSWLIVTVCCEGLCLLGGDGGVSLDETGHHTTSCLNTKRERGHIKQQQVANSSTIISIQDSSLNSCTIGNSFIRIDGFVQLFAIEEILQQLLYLGNSGATSNENNLLNRRLVQL